MIILERTQRKKPRNVSVAFTQGRGGRILTTAKSEYGTFDESGPSSAIGTTWVALILEE